MTYLFRIPDNLERNLCLNLVLTDNNNVCCKQVATAELAWSLHYTFSQRQILFSFLKKITYKIIIY